MILLVFGLIEPSIESSPKDSVSAAKRRKTSEGIRGEGN
jgi:hypothetical protein